MMSVRESCEHVRQENLTKEYQRRLPGGGNVRDLKHDEVKIERKSVSDLG